MAKERMLSAHVNAFRNSRGGVFLPGEIISEVEFSCPAFHGFDTRGVSIPTATRNFSGQYYEALFKIKEVEARIFRKYNEGVGTAYDDYERRVFKAVNAGSRVEMDINLYNGTDGAGIAAWEQRKKDRVDGAVRTLEHQFYYGEPREGVATNEAMGFPGLRSFVHEDMIYDAKGTGPDLASAYFIYFHPERGVTWLMGENGNMNFGEPRLESVTYTDPNTGETLEFEALKTFFWFWPGLACQGKYTVLRIANIDVSTADQLDKDRDAFTDEMIMTALAKWKIGAPNAAITTKKAATLLGASRKASMIDVATNNEIIVSAGQTQIARDCDGGNIPLAISDALSDTEPRLVV